MQKSKRLMELMMAVNRKRSFTVQELADEFGVSSRTIQRDLQALSELGVPLYFEAGPHGGYRMINRRVLPPIAFTEEEAVALFFACHALRHYSSLPFGAETSLALEKFYAYLPEDARERIDQLRNRFDLVTPRRQALSPHLSKLLGAAIEQQVVKIDYVSKSDCVSREIQPVGIFAQNGYWYCPAYCFLRADFRVFRCDRITAVHLDPDSAAQPLDLRDVHLGNRSSFARRDQMTMQLEVELTPNGVQQCEATLYALPQLCTFEDGSGRLTGEFAQSDLTFLARTFIGMGPDATVKQPQALIDAIKAMLSEMWAKYAK